MSNSLPVLTGIARQLVLDGLLEVQQARHLYQIALERNIPFIEYVVSQAILAAGDIASALSQDFGLPLLDIEAFDLSLVPKELADEKLVMKHQALPLLQQEDRLYIGVSDPTNLMALSDFKFHSGINPHVVIVEQDKLKSVIQIILYQKQNTISHSLEEVDLELLASTADEIIEPGIIEKNPAEDAPLVRFIQKIILDAMNHSVSDIHFEPYDQSYRIRYRRDGILYEVASPPLALATRMTARLKVMSRLDISERRIPQDGRFKIILSKNRMIEFRVSTLPTIAGEKVVLRILDPHATKIGVEMLGFDAEQQKLFLSAIHQPQGMVLVTGPTGSGKTVTLYTALNILNVKGNNICTVEDPVEINLEGINQVNVNNKVGLTFANALRAFLRQDPDILMLGEIRDLETAETAIKAAQTGHMVLSTLHTNNASETLTRLSSMGIPRYNIGSTVSLVIAQRLARRLCHRCRIIENDVSSTVLKEVVVNMISNPSVACYKANLQGCEYCKHGYSGRVGLYEMLPITQEVEHVIVSGGSTGELLEIALRQGMVTLRAAGIARILDGTTSLEEINRVTVA